MSVKAMSITNITNKMLENKKEFQGSELSKDLQKLLNEGILVAHNAKFDSAILAAEGISVPRSICTFRVARHLDPMGIIPEYNLPFLRYYFELEVSDAVAHDAEDDVKVLHAVFGKLLEKMKEEVLGASGIEAADNEEKAIEAMLEVSSHPALFKIFNFGKYKDSKIEEVAKNDRRYLEWMLDKKYEDGGQDEDWIYTLEHYLKNN